MRKSILSAALLLAFALPARAQTATQVWATRYNGPANGDDSPSALAMDGSGNVVVTGSSCNASGNTDYYTAKYAAADGSLLWERRYDGPGHRADQPAAIVVDGSGDVVVTGYSTGSGSQQDCYTAKYAALDGALLWERRYDGPGHFNDGASAIVIDGSGNVIVTGSSERAPFDADFYTAKYAAGDGHILWEQHYTGPGAGDSAKALAVDGTGNVIVTGSSQNFDGNSNYYTAKYAAVDGSLLWEKRYDLHAGQSVATAVALDGSGNVIVTGQSGDGRNDFYTAKYASADGSLLWERRYNGPADQSDCATAVAVDGAGNVLVTGYSLAANFSADVYTAKYASADGSVLWERRYNSPGNGDDAGRSIALDGAGNVVVAGSSPNANGYSDYYIAKYASANGSVLWEQRYNGPGNSYDYIDKSKQLALTPDGGVVVTGRSASGTNYDYATVRYTPPATTFAQWKLARLGDASAPNNGDPDLDGLSNILEYALGTDPLRRTALPVASTAGNHSALTFPRITTATDVTLTVQGSDDLATWTDLASSTGGAAMVALVAGVTANESGAGALRTVEVRDLYLLGDPAHPRRFLRLLAAP